LYFFLLNQSTKMKREKTFHFYSVEINYKLVKGKQNFIQKRTRIINF
jgi:hypothetical protein